MKDKTKIFKKINKAIIKQEKKEERKRQKRKIKIINHMVKLQKKHKKQIK